MCKVVRVLPQGTLGIEHFIGLDWITVKAKPDESWVAEATLVAEITCSEEMLLDLLFLKVIADDMAGVEVLH